MYYYICSLFKKIMFRIKEIIKEKNLKVSDIADNMGIAQPSLSNLINGKTKPSLDMLERIAEALQVSVKDLFANDGITGFIKVKEDIREINSISDIEKLLTDIKGK